MINKDENSRLLNTMWVYREQVLRERKSSYNFKRILLNTKGVLITVWFCIGFFFFFFFFYGIQIFFFFFFYIFK